MQLAAGIELTIIVQKFNTFYIGGILVLSSKNGNEKLRIWGPCDELSISWTASTATSTLGNCAKATLVGNRGANLRVTALSGSASMKV
jgi:hypothetical protein